LSVETQNYRYLDAEHIVATIDRLGARISERFPQSGLAAVCSELRDVAASAKDRSIEIGRPMSVLRVSAALFALTVIVAGIASAPRLPIIGGQMDVADFIQSLEATTNIVVLLGAALFFLVSLETRIRRRKALAALHELRSIAHIIDMHQLTKDPERVRPDATFTDAYSPSAAAVSGLLFRNALAHGQAGRPLRPALR